MFLRVILLIIILMEVKDNKQGTSFLDKFKGRANKVDKTGLNSALDPVKLSTPQKDKEPTPRRLPSLDRKNNQSYHNMSKGDLGQLVLSPEAKNQEHGHLFHKITTPPKRNRNKLDFLPPINPSPSNTNRKNSQAKPSSRPISDKSENLQRRVFGKYLKLDDQAMKHLEYLQQMDKDRAKRKASGYSTQRSQR